jgi:uridine phosphorylase
MTEALSELPLFGFDLTLPAIIEPSAVLTRADVGGQLVMCFFQEVIENIASQREARLVHTLRSEAREFPIFEIDHHGKRLAFMHAGLGAPLSAGLMEEVIALGFHHIMACGGCGVLDSALAVGHLLLPVAAIRDEGTSYHYLPPSSEVMADPESIQALENTLGARNIPYLETKTWTTDALYRETAARADRFRKAGCLAVEMEAAAMMAVAQFRGVNFGQLLYGGDTVIEGAWDRRDWYQRGEIRENLFWLTAEACLSLGES